MNTVTALKKKPEREPFALNKVLAVVSKTFVFYKKNVAKHPLNLNTPTGILRALKQVWEAMVFFRAQSARSPLSKHYEPARLNLFGRSIFRKKKRESKQLYFINSTYYSEDTILVTLIQISQHSTYLIKDNFIIFYYFNSLNNALKFLSLDDIKVNINFKRISIYLLNMYKKVTDDGFFYIRGLFIIFFIDASLTDDEPLWEPIEWSLFQT